MKTKSQAALSMNLRLMQRVLATVTLAVERKTAIPALSAVRIRPMDGAVEFTATSKTLSVRAKRTVPGALSADPLLLPALKLEGYTRLLDGDTVSLAVLDSRRAALHCGGTATKLPLVTEGVFPFIELPPSDGPMIAVEQDKMERMLRFAAFAVSREEKHANLRGALFEVADGEASLVATDGHRLARYSVKTKAAPTRMLLPEALLGAMSKTVDKDAGGSCSLVATDGSVFACLEDSAGDVCLSHRPVAGPFPNYRAILPSKAEASVRVAAASVALAVRRCMSFADASQLVSMTVMPAELRLSAAEVSTGETVDKLPVSSAFQFPALTLHFRGGYLLEALTRIDGDVTLSFARVGANMGLWITHMPVEDERFEYVLMSLHLKA